MTSRRELLLGATAAGFAVFGQRLTAVMARASQPATPVSFPVPVGACDCHTHVYDPKQFPFWSGRTYTPESASVDEMRSLHSALHIDRVVIVNSAVYGTDNAVTIDAIRRLGPRARGIALIDEKTTDSQLDQLDRGGMRGIRVNFETFGIPDPATARKQLRTAVERLAGRGWHIQLYTRLSLLDALQDQIMSSPLPVVFDHFVLAQASLGLDQPGFGTLLSLLRTGNAYVKISAPYRISARPPDYVDAAPLAAALVAANPERVLWGSDWPHPDSTIVPGRRATDVTPLYQVDDGRVLNELARWTPDVDQRKKILVENPARLYGF